MFQLIFLGEGFRMFMRRIRISLVGYPRYSGSCVEILKKGIADCWNAEKEYFMVSPGHFCEFYTRDFGWCVPSLLKLGYKKEVQKTLRYALEQFEKKGKICVAINPSGRPFDFPNEASDSLPYLFRSLLLLNDKKLIREYTFLLNMEIDRYFREIFDKDLGLVRKDHHFSSIKDQALRKSSTYDNIMVAMLKNDIVAVNKLLGGKKNTIHNPFAPYNIKKRIKEELWNGTYFYDDLEKQNIVTGDANVFPFSTGVFTDKKMFRSCNEAMKKAGLCDPFPLKYSPKKFEEHKMILYSIFSQDYEHDSIWMHIGMVYLQLLQQFRHPDYEKVKKHYVSLVEEYGTFVEVFAHDGSLYKTPFYFTDTGMLWGSMLLEILEKKKK